MVKVLITGGAGFIGHFIARQLSDRPDYQVTLIDNHSRGISDSDHENLLQRPNVKHVIGDMTDAEFVKSLPKDFDYVYHLAAVIGVQNVMDHPDRVLFVNAISTLLLFEELKSFTNLKRVIFSSTSEIYAGTLKHFGIEVPTSEDVPLTLDDIASNRTTYMLSKMYGESIAHNYQKKYGIPFTIVRYHNVFGPRMGFKHVIPEMFCKLTSNDQVTVASPDHTRAFCYVDDAVDMTVGLAESAQGLNDTFHIGNQDGEVSIFNLVSLITDVVGAEVDLQRGEETPGSPVRRCPEISKVKHALGLNELTSLRDGVERTWAWYKDRLDQRHE